MTNVSVVCLVVDDPDQKEERRFEHGMSHQQGDPSRERLFETGTEADGQETELRDRSVGEDRLEVVLPQGAPSTEQHRRATHDQHHWAPQRSVSKGRSKTSHQINARLDHGRRMQVRRDGCWPCHGTRQPRMKRHLC